jgi:hypothetical protein
VLEATVFTVSQFFESTSPSNRPLLKPANLMGLTYGDQSVEDDDRDVTDSIKLFASSDLMRLQQACEFLGAVSPRRQRR